MRVMMYESDQGNWSPTFHDNTWLDWVITLSYLGAAGLCVYAWHRERRDRGGPTPCFWLVMGILMAFLGVNKQFNLQTAVEEWGRGMAQETGVYEKRRSIQRMFVICFGGAGLALMVVLTWWVRKNLKRYGWALGGLLFAGAYAAVRAATFNHVITDVQGPRHHPYSQEILEVIAIGLTVAGAWLAVKASVPRGKANTQPFERTVRIR